jgi:hypothetical protein
MVQFEIIDTGYTGMLGFKRFICKGDGFTGYGRDSLDAWREWAEARYIGDAD